MITPRMSLGRSTTPSGGHELFGPATSQGNQGVASDVFVNGSSQGRIGSIVQLAYVSSAVLLIGVVPA